MLSFVRRQSGATIYISHNRQRFNDSHAMQLSAKEFGIIHSSCDARGAVSVPSAFGVFKSMRSVAIREAIRNKKPDRQIAREFGASLRHVKIEKSRLASRSSR